MTKTNSKIWRSATVAAIVLGSATGLIGLNPAAAATKTGDTVSITVNKKDGLGLNSVIQNTGGTMSEFSTLPNVAGAGFTVYNITKAFYDDYDGTNGDALIASLTANIDSIVTDAMKVGTEQITGANGQATFGALPEKQDYKGQAYNAVYAIVETSHAANMIGSQPMIVAMPIYTVGSTTELNKNIQLYPKNYGVDKVLLDADGNPITDETAVNDYEVGAVLTYRVKFAIPSDIGTTLADGSSLYRSLKLSDEMTATGADFVGIDSIMAGSTAASELEALGALTSSNNPAKWSMTFNVSTAATREALAKYAGKTITIDYKVQINENFVVDSEVSNDFTVDLNRNGASTSQTDDGPNVTTGGSKFVKVDQNNEEQTLADAEFKLRNNAGQYAKITYTDGKISAIAWGTEADATVIKSNTSGNVLLTGLEYGNYVLVETKAPNGYLTPTGTDAETAFTVKKGASTNVIKIANVGENPGSLPLTGGIGILTLFVVGASLMGAAAMKKKEKA